LYASYAGPPMSIVFTICETSNQDEPSIAFQVSEQIDRLELATPLTTREPLGAKGDAFVFTSREIFERMIVREELLEHTQILGNYYGTPYDCLQNAIEEANDLLIKVDERETALIKHKLPDAVSILVKNASSRQRELLNTSHLKVSLLDRLPSGTSPDPNQFDHVIAKDRVEEKVEALAGVIRYERLRRS